MTDKTVLLQDLEAYTEEEKYYIRCLELQQPPKLLSFFDAFPDDQTRVFMERHPRFAPCPPHAHEFFEIFYVMTGTCGQQLDDRHFLLHQGDVGFLAPGSVHTLEITDDSLVFSIYIRRDTFDRVFSRTLSYDNILSDFFMSSLYSKTPTGSILFYETEEDIRDQFLDLFDEFTHPDAFTPHLMENMLPLLFAALLRRYADQSYTSYAGPGQYSGVRLRMLSYIYDHYQDVTLEKLADTFDYSVAHCSRLIRQETGTGFSALVRRIRMNQAIDLLRRTSHTVAEISERIGYQSPEAFIRAFQKEYGVSPTGFRQIRN